MKISTKNILDGFGKAVGKYSLGHDSAKQEIVALQKLIKDSANRKTTIIKGDYPILNFSSDGMVVDSLTHNNIKVTVSIQSYSAPSILQYARLYCIYAYNQEERFYKELKYDNTSNFLIKNVGIPKEGKGIQTIDIENYNLTKHRELIILIKGSYTDSYAKNPRPLDIIGNYFFHSKKFGLMPSPYDDSIRIFLKKQGVMN